MEGGRKGGGRGGIEWECEREKVSGVQGKRGTPSFSVRLLT